MLFVISKDEKRWTKNFEPKKKEKLVARIGEYRRKPNTVWPLFSLPLLLSTEFHPSFHPSSDLVERDSSSLPPHPPPPPPPVRYIAEIESEKRIRRKRVSNAQREQFLKWLPYKEEARKIFEAAALSDIEPCLLGPVKTGLERERRPWPRRGG